MAIESFDELLFGNTIMKAVRRMNHILERQISKRKNLYYMMKHVNHNAIIRGIRLLTASEEELARA